MARASRVVVTVLGLAAAAACHGSAKGAGDYAPAPTAVHCTDAPQLRQRAVDARRRSVETSSDQARVVAGNRATFYASLAIIADLKCRAALAEADEALKPALDAARKAEAAGSFYEEAVHWGEAGFIVLEVVPILMKELPDPAPLTLHR
jgi:hypothetical protein